MSTTISYGLRLVPALVLCSFPAAAAAQQLLPNTGNDADGRPALSNATSTEPPVEASPVVDAAQGTSHAVVTASVFCQRGEPAPGQPDPLVDALARRIVPDHALESGAMVDYLVAELQANLCRDASARAWLQASCTPLHGANVLITLRSRFVSDLLALLRRMGQVSGAPTSSARVVSALLAAVTRDDPTRVMVESLVLSAAWTQRGGQTPDLCAGATDWSERAAAHATTGLDRALVVLVGVLDSRPDPSLDLSERTRVYERAILLALARLQLAAELRARTANAPQDAEAIAEELRRTAREQLETSGERVRASLSPEQRRALAELVVLIDARPTHGRFTALSDEHAVDACLAVLGNALELAAGTRADLDGVAQSFGALTRGELVEALAPSLETVASAAPSTTANFVPWSAQEAHQLIERLALLERFLKARGNTARWRVARNSLLGLDSWADRVLLDGSVGAAAVDFASGDYRLALDLSLGYEGEEWGFLANGALHSFDITDTGSIETLDYYQGSGEFWWAQDPASAVRLDGRLNLGAALYDSDHLLYGQDILYDESSVMGRASLLAGIRAEGSWTSVGFWLGGGGQYEIYDSFNLRDGTDDGRETFGAQLQGRLAARVTLSPGVLALRARLEAVRFSITRLRQLTDVAAGTVNTVRTEWSELDVGGHSSLDLEVLRFGGFVPGVYAGAAYHRREANGVIEQVWVPDFGAKIRREWF